MQWVDSLGQSLFQSSEEGGVVSAEVGLALCLGVKDGAFGAGWSEEGYLKTASHTWICVELILELSCTDVGLNLRDQINAVAAVASAATVLDLDNVLCVLVALDFVGFPSGLHNFSLYLLYNSRIIFR